ncbi:hypothetical protein KM043_016261 [Ampulex compressa]|nr:hypothetical protein KM043_016261 [Ampulex compressa]
MRSQSTSRRRLQPLSGAKLQPPDCMRLGRGWPIWDLESGADWKTSVAAHPHTALGPTAMKTGNGVTSHRRLIVFFLYRIPEGLVEMRENIIRGRGPGGLLQRAAIADKGNKDCGWCRSPEYLWL